MSVQSKQALETETEKYAYWGLQSLGLIVTVADTSTTAYLNNYAFLSMETNIFNKVSQSAL